MRAIVLAAGRGTRLAPYTSEIPKCMLPIGDYSILERQTRTLQRAGINEIVVVKGFGAEHVNLPGLRYYVNDQYETTNMVQSLFSAEKELHGDVIVSYGDILYSDYVLRELLSGSPSGIAVVGDTRWCDYYQRRFGDPYLEAESFAYDSDGRILQIGASRPSRSNVQAQYIGLIRFTEAGCQGARAVYHDAKKRYWDREWKRGRTFRDSYMTDFLQALIEDGAAVHVVPIERGWLEFDSARDYEMVLEWYQDGSIREFCDIDDGKAPCPDQEIHEMSV